MNRKYGRDRCSVLLLASAPCAEFSRFQIEHASTTAAHHRINLRVRRARQVPSPA